MAGLSGTLEKIKNREPSWKEQPTRPSLTSSSSDRAVHKKKPPVFVRIRVVTHVISLVRFGCVAKLPLLTAKRKTRRVGGHSAPSLAKGVGVAPSLLAHADEVIE